MKMGHQTLLFEDDTVGKRSEGFFILKKLRTPLDGAGLLAENISRKR